MKLLTKKEFNYDGFRNGKHCFTSIDGKINLQALECKYRDTSSDETFICLSDGTFERTFHTQRRLMVEQH